jgi:AcrR family transcriptional regulator
LIAKPGSNGAAHEDRERYVFSGTYFLLDNAESRPQNEQCSAMATARRERLKQEIRADIITAARDLFVTEGYVNVSMRKIADRVGCAPGTIYLHFEDKDSILSAICVETFARLSRRMEAIRNDKGDPVERLRRGGRQYILFALDHPYHYLVTFGLNGTGQFKSDEARRAGQESFNCMRDCVRLCVDAGRFRIDDVEQIAQSLWACLHGVVMLLISKSDFASIEQNRLIDSVLDIALEGLRKS